jgi:cytochrome c oxidase subunit 2
MTLSRMRRAPVALAAMLAGLLEVNAGGEAGGPPPGRPPIGMMPAKKLQATLETLSSSGQTGSVEINDEAGRAVVLVTVVGEPKGATEPAHIHVGKCPAPGDVKWSLNSVVDGKSTTTLDVGVDELLAAGDIAVNVHKSASEIATYVACGDLHLPSDRPVGAMLKEGVTGPDVDTRQVSGGVGAVVSPGDKGAAAGGVAVNAGGSVAVGGQSVTIKMTAKQFAFDPAEVRVKLGTRVRLLVTSTDVAHGLAIPAFNVNASLPPNIETAVEFVADQKGEFPFFCNTFCGSGHMGMRGTLIVE